MRPIHEHGAFQTFQAFPETPTATLLKEAQQKGYWTIGVFPDQLTSWVGSQAGFDEDRSGPLGWRHLVTFYVQNSSLFLPLVRPLFPHLPFSDAPPNHSGTFTYNVNRELNEIFSAHTPGRKTFVAAHLTYLHTPCFPKYFELSWKERLEILRAKVWSVKDRSFDWQDVHLPTDPFRLREWKIKRLLAAVSRTVDETQFLERGGSLILFSDHGDRVGLNMENFWRAQYHHVLFVTFGLPQRDPTRPISLLEIGALLGFAPFATTFPPVVELSLAQAMEWHTLIRSGHLHKDGTVTFDLQLLTDLFRQLRVYRPWPQETLPQISSAFNVAGKVPKEPPFSLGVQIKQALPTVER
jgi:hypothetical protein